MNLVALVNVGKAVSFAYSQMDNIIALIVLAEKDLGPGKGADKLAQVKAGLEKIAGVGAQVEAYWPMLASLIGLLVPHLPTKVEPAPAPVPTPAPDVKPGTTPGF